VKAGKIHKLAPSLYKPRGSKCGNKVAAYSPEITVPVCHQENVNGYEGRFFKTGLSEVAENVLNDYELCLYAIT
jgi:hypothetical protein